MEDEAPAELKRFGALAGALWLAGSLPLLICGAGMSA